MSLVERNYLNLVVKSYTVHLVGQAIVDLTTEPSTTKLVAFTVLRHMSGEPNVLGKILSCPIYVLRVLPGQQGSINEVQNKDDAFFLYS